MHNAVTQAVAAKSLALGPPSDARARRPWAAGEARAIGPGGIIRGAEATGLSRATIRAGLRGLGLPIPLDQGRSPSGRLRRPDGGRKSLTEHDPGLLRAPEAPGDPVSRGDPMSPSRWACKSAAKSAAGPRSRGHPLSERTVNRLLHDLGSSPQSDRRTIEGRQHPDRDARFRYINRGAKAFQGRGQPVVSVATKKEELVGRYRDGGRERQPQGEPEEVKVHGFIDKGPGEAIPYGAHDMAADTGWVSAGVGHGTAEFAVGSLRRWWRDRGSRAYPGAKRLLITADGGGPDGSRCRLWRVGPQRSAAGTGLSISVCHFPPGTSQWDEIEHRTSCHISEGGRGRPLVSREVVVNSIGHTTTEAGPSLRSELDGRSYPAGREVTDEQMEGLSIGRDDFPGEGNYTIRPRT